MRPHSDRLLLFDDGDEAVPMPRHVGPRPNTLGAALFLLSLVAGVGAALYVLVTWHVVRMH